MSLKDRVRRPSTCRPHPKIKFSKEEDERLRQVINHYGVQDWDVIAEQMPGRNQRQCRERWTNYLAPTVNKEPFSAEEDQLLIEKYNEHGSRWVRIAKFFNGRSDTAIKNRWMTLQRKILLEEEEKLAHVYDEPNQNPDHKKISNIDKINKLTNKNSKSNNHSIPILSTFATNASKRKNHKKSFSDPKSTPSIKPNLPDRTIISSIDKQISLNSFPNSNIIYQPQTPVFTPQSQSSMMIVPPFQQQTNQINSYQQFQPPIISNQNIQQKQQTFIQQPNIQNQFNNHREQLTFKKDSNIVDANDEVDFWSEVFSSNEFQSNADMFNWY